MSLPIAKVPDDGGDEVTVVTVKDVVMPNFSHDVLLHMQNITLRSDDIILVTYPKSGTHWVFEMTKLLLACDSVNDSSSKDVAMLEMRPEANYADLPSPRILNTHAPITLLPQNIFEKKPKIIYLIRNPKDIAVSFHNFICKIPIANYSGKWENFIRPFFEGKFFYGSWFDYTKKWEGTKTEHPELPILTLFYEDLKEDPVAGARQLCQFLGLERDDAFLKDVCDQCDFDKMKQLKEASPITKTLQTYRKGQVGDWKNWFTVAQNEWFDQLYKEKMAGVDLNVRFTL